MDENDVRRSMRSAVDDIAVRPLDTPRLRNQARRRSRLTAVAVVAGVGLTVTGAAAIAAVTREDRVTPAAGSECPTPAVGPAPGDARAEVAAGPSDTMVSPRPRNLLVCRYAADAPDRPVARALPGDSVVAERILGYLNELEPMPAQPGPSCPFNGADLYNIVVENADGRTTVVAVDPDGCRAVSNGTRQGFFAPPDLIRMLGDGTG